ncbi:MAG TPA: carbohydrate binding family 9 domain-containing protein, partial [Vicinamibacterales bacterium]|nr:carbohydrate binding family 9 domain-containing protein [Vicinamibacterales bacterium]
MLAPTAAASQPAQPGPLVAPSASHPTAPAPAATVHRDGSGRVTVEAVRVGGQMVVDGLLSEEIYGSIPPIDGFIQQEPQEGLPAANRTEVWLLYDDQHIYVGARCWTADPARIVANEMRRDAHSIFQNDNFGVFFDTFHDRRNGFFFYTNPLGALSDQLISDERETNRDWNTVWEVRTSRFEGGWTVEMAIPFRSLRYPAPGPQTWGVQMRRVARGTNEFSYLTPMPAAFTQRAIVRVAQAATLLGLEAPPAARNVELKP